MFQQIGMVHISVSKEDKLPLFHNGLSAGVAKGWFGKKTTYQSLQTVDRSKINGDEAMNT